MAEDPGMQALRARLDAWRAVPRDEQARRAAEDAASARPPSEADVRLAMAAELCPSGTGPCGCGSGPPRSCGREGRPSLVHRPACLECQARDWWEAGVEAGW